MHLYVSGEEDDVAVCRTTTAAEDDVVCLTGVAGNLRQTNCATTIHSRRRCRTRRQQQ